MPDDFLSLFDNVKVDNTQRISENDRAVCGHLQSLFEKSLAQLRSWQTRLAETLASDPNAMFKFNDYNGVQTDFDYSRPSIGDTYRRYEFTPMYDMIALSKLMLKLCENHEGRIIDHFNKTYGCGFKSTHVIARTFFGDIIDCPRFESGGSWGDPRFRTPRKGPAIPGTGVPAPSYELVVDGIVEALGGMSFAQREKKEVYDALGDEISWKEISCTGKKVKIGWMTKLSFSGDTFSHWETSGNVDKVLKAAKIFFGKDFDARFNLGAETFGIEYEVLNSAVVKLKPYKNRSMDFVFGTAQEAQDFFALCGRLKEEAKQKREM